ncbi:MAG: CHAT domain-containing protein, partial [Bacteroidetes bacterium]
MNHKKKAMSDEKQKPVIVVAFANSYLKGERLPHLVRERREILNKLKTESKDYCEVVAEANSSADFLFDLMRQRQYQHRIAILHFGGHAEGGVLRFETETGQREDITAEHFAGVLKTIDSLKLVFLNGCGTQTIVEALFDAGISVVIATDSAIVDKQAARFAEEFYTGIAGGFSIEQSFEQAKNICEHLFKQNWVHKEVEVGRGISWDEEEAGTPGGRLPWGLYVAEDKKEDLHWKLEVPAAHSFVSAPNIKQPLLSPLESMLVKVFAGALIFMGIILGLGWLLGIPGPNMSGVKAESDISFPKNKFNILIYPIKEDSTNTAYTRDLYDRLVLLNADDKLNLGLMLYDESASNGGLPKFEEVQDEQVAAQYGLDMVVWGSVKPSGIVVNYIITDSMARSFKPSGQKIEPVANFSLFGKGKPGTIEGDVHDVLYYMAGMKELIGGNYFRALTYFDRINIDGGGLDE